MARPEGILGPHGPGVGGLGFVKNAVDGSGSSSPQESKKRIREPLPASGTGDPTHAKSAPKGIWDRQPNPCEVSAGMSTGEGNDGARGGLSA